MKFLITLSLSLLVLASGQQALAQTASLSPWQIGFGVGYTNYSGDLSNYRIHGFRDITKLYHFADYNKYYIDKPSLSVMIHKNVTPTLGFMIQANSVSFGMSDRYRNKNGSIDTSALHYARSLNFRTSLQDIGLAFTFRTNNGKFLPENAFFSPSFFLGAGVSRFKVMGDLYDQNNQPYNYRLPGVVNDDTYETNLRDLTTETDEKYTNVIPYVDLGLGLNFRLSNLVTLSVQSDIKYSASDYLDDVSGVYKASYATPAQQYAARPGYNLVNPLTLQRGDNNGTNDFYINNRVMLNIGLGKRKKERAFTAPAIYALSMPYSPEREKESDSLARVQAARRDSLLTAKTDSLALLAKKNDSLSKLIDSGLVRRKVLTRDDSLRNGLDSIRSELKEIKGLLQEQQVRPRYAQLQSQADSLKALQTRISSQRSISHEDNLRLRIYQLQSDSIRNEMQKMQQTHGELLPANNQPVQNTQWISLPPLSATTPTQQVVTDTVYTPASRAYDSIRTAAAIKNYDAQVKQLQQDKRYKSDKAYKKTVDSMSRKLADYEKQVKTSKVTVRPAAAVAPVVRKDTVISQQDQRRVDSLQRRMRELEQKLNIQGSNDTAAYNRLRQEAEQRIAYNRAVDSENLNRSIAQMESRINTSNDSVSYWKRQLQRANDSAAYYNKLASSVSQDDDTKKAKWYQEIFSTKRSKERAVSEAAERDRLAEQQQNFQQQAARTNRVIDDLERRNRDLSDQYEDLVSNRNRRRLDGDNWVQPVPAAVLYGNNNNNGRDYDELRSLREEISRLRGEVNDASKRSSQFYYPPSGVAPAVTVPVETVRQAPVATVRDSASVTAPVQDTATINALRSGLEQLRGQLDSMKNNRAVAPVREAPVNDRYDVKSFPIVSVYFASGSTVLSADQIRKLTPLAQVAVKNPDATVMLKAFTDPTGNPAVNEAIARKRSAYVKSLLTTRFKIGEERITADEPSVSESSRTRKPNPLDRRVDLQFN